jgi:hypothetical protein
MSMDLMEKAMSVKYVAVIGGIVYFSLVNIHMPVGIVRYSLE